MDKDEKECFVIGTALMLGGAVIIGSAFLGGPVICFAAISKSLLPFAPLVVYLSSSSSK